MFKYSWKNVNAVIDIDSEIDKPYVKISIGKNQYTVKNLSMIELGEFMAWAERGIERLYYYVSKHPRTILEIL